MGMDNDDRQFWTARIDSVYKKIDHEQGRVMSKIDDVCKSIKQNAVEIAVNKTKTDEHEKNQCENIKEHHSNEHKGRTGRILLLIAAIVASSVGALKLVEFILKGVSD